METNPVSINTTKGEYTFNRCSRCHGCVFVILTGHGFIDVVVCDTCHSIQIIQAQSGMVSGPTSTVQPDDPMRRHTSIHESDGPAANHDYDVVSDKGEARHSTTSQVHTGYDVETITRRDEQTRFAIHLLGFAEGYARNHDDGTVVPTEAIYFALIDYLATYVASNRTG